MSFRDFLEINKGPKTIPIYFHCFKNRYKGFSDAWIFAQIFNEKTEKKPVFHYFFGA